jgi:hypothetical protein
MPRRFVSCAWRWRGSHAWLVPFLHQSPRFGKRREGTGATHHGFLSSPRMREVGRGARQSGLPAEPRSIWRDAGWDAERPEAARNRGPPRIQTAPPNGASSGHKPGAKGLAHANASQSPPSPPGVAIRGGGISPGGGHPHPPLGDPGIPPGGIRGVLYMYPRPRVFFEGGCSIPPR